MKFKDRRIKKKKKWGEKKEETIKKTKAKIQTGTFQTGVYLKHQWKKCRMYEKGKKSRQKNLQCDNGIKGKSYELITGKILAFKK